MAESLVAVSTYGRRGPSSRVRLYDWCDHLGLQPTVFDYGGHSNNGFGTLVRDPRSLIRSEFELRRLRAERLFICRQASPFSRGKLEAALLSRAHHSVYDFDDALFADHRTSLAALFDKRLKCQRSVEAADVVIAGNDYLAAWASEISNNVVVIPSCVEPDRYPAKQSWEIGDPPSIVWIGSPSTEKFLGVAASGLRAAHEKFGARLTVISAGDADLGGLADMVDRVAWAEDSYASALAQADIAIAPLIDDEFARGKCAYKLLQYAAVGLPMIGSPVGANAVALDRFQGLAAHSSDDWVAGLAQLLTESSERRRDRGQAGVAGVRDHYSFNRWRDLWRANVGV